jgi:hypothetical protein
MWRLIGLCKKTLRMVEVAIATCPEERERILSEESGNYYGLKAYKIRLVAA